MPRKKTKKSDIAAKIRGLEKLRSSSVFVYYTGNKEPQQVFGAQVASDVIPKCVDMLEYKLASKKDGKITLVLNTNGGMLETPWPLVNLFREYSSEFEVIVLERALSAGTLISLGADRIIMLPFSHLSPIDPAATFPGIEKENSQRFEIEDVIGYIDFVKEKIGITEQGALVEMMKSLTQQIKPSSLGSVNRAHSLIRSLAKKMLDLHVQRISDKQKKDIIEHLTQKLFAHNHLINRREAKDVVGFGDIIEFADPATEKVAKSINESYKRLMKIDEQFSPHAYLKEGEVEASFELVRAVLEASEIGFHFVTKYQILRTPDPSGRQQLGLNAETVSWRKV